MHTQHNRTPMLTRVLVTLTTTLLAASACDTQDAGAARDTEADALLEEEDAVDAELEQLVTPARDPETRPDIEAPTDQLTLAVDPQAYNNDVGPFSEEHPAGLCGFGQAVQSIKCTGGYCDNLTLDCEPHGAEIVYGDGFLNYDISEENPDTFALCPADGMVDGVDCAGSNCDNLTVHCEYTDLARSNLCDWSGWFSEEQGWANVPLGTAVAGIQCSGRYCDRMNLYWCLMI
ncbi:MAG: hypothetical protein IAG13_19630 [Deltaproteobacteria bacterium]|nr:hypothetical protein [Nannocystaceae bacterium]